jgi:hypothetical protein
MYPNVNTRSSSFSPLGTLIVSLVVSVCDISAMTNSDRGTAASFALCLGNANLQVGIHEKAPPQRALRVFSTNSDSRDCVSPASKALPRQLLPNRRCTSRQFLVRQRKRVEHTLPSMPAAWRPLVCARRTRSPFAGRSYSVCPIWIMRNLQCSTA